MCGVRVPNTDGVGHGKELGGGVGEARGGVGNPGGKKILLTIRRPVHVQVKVTRTVSLCTLVEIYTGRISVAGGYTSTTESIVTFFSNLMYT